MATATIPPANPPPHAHPLKHLLDKYTTSHPLRSPSPLPASSRVDPKLIQRRPPAAGNPLLWTIPTWITFARFATAKGLHLIWSLSSHFLWGPARKSWGYRMTFIASFMRNVADHTSLADIVLIRRLISLHFLVPLPADAVVTPITFIVPRHTGTQIARGFLRDLDKLETGRRELSGEWVVGTDVWKRLKAERRIRHRHVNSTTTTTNSKPDGKSASAPPTLSDSIPSIGRNSPDVDADSDSWVATRKSGEKERVIYYVHGGAYYVGNAATHRSVTIGMSKACNARVFAITYRLAPENVFPLPLHDVLHGYLRLLAPPLSISPENIIIAGDSAGGGLSLALCMYLRDEGYKMPAGIILMSPWVDLTMSCGSWDENMEWDVVPQPKADDHLNPVGCYLGPTGIATYLTHPYASPLFGDLQDLPPMLIQSGDSEVLRDEITLLAHKATLAGVQVTHELYEDMVHVFQMFTFLPAAQAAIKSVGRWVRVTLPRMEEERSRDWNVPIDEGVEVSGDMGGVGGMDGVDGVDGEMDSGATKMVSEDGQVVGKKSGRSEVTPSEMTSTGDARRTQRQGHGSLRLNLQPSSDQPSIDLDSLPANSRSGSPTPTGSPIQPSSPDPFGSSRSHGPRLRRALTDFAATSTPASPIHSPPQHAMRQRRRTQGAASLHVSPAHSTSNPSDRDRSPVISPSPSIRRRLRSPTVSSTSHPTMRNRSQSHSDIFHLVEGYVEGGAANETVVYAPGGEIRSVGVLGEDLEDE